MNIYGWIAIGILTLALVISVIRRRACYFVADPKQKAVIHIHTTDPNFHFEVLTQDDLLKKSAEKGYPLTTEELTLLLLEASHDHHLEHQS